MSQEEWMANRVCQKIFRRNLLPCDNGCMNTKNAIETAPESPLLREENGELSLHFGFPTIQSRMIKSDPERLILDYTRTMMGFLLLQPSPEHIAMIGLGGGSLAKYCRRTLPACAFTAVELSPEVIALRDTFGVPADDALFKVICADGADFVRENPRSFDAVLVDGFNAEGQPEQLCSSGFYDDCYAALRAGGVLVVNLCTDDPGQSSYLARIRRSFKTNVVAVEADEGDNTIVFACKDSACPPPFTELASRLRRLESRHPIELDKTLHKLLRPAHPGGGKRKKRR